jgi:hypothetical protein
VAKNWYGEGYEIKKRWWNEWWTQFNI